MLGWGGGRGRGGGGDSRFLGVDSSLFIQYFSQVLYCTVDAVETAEAIVMEGPDFGVPRTKLVFNHFRLQPHGGKRL